MPEDRHHIVFNSSNSMLPGATVVSLPTSSCPDSCPLLGDGCQMERGRAGIHRRAHDNGEYDYYTFDEMIPLMKRKFSRIHRPQVNGDLWATDSTGEMVEPTKMRRYISSCNSNKLLPIIYTHKPVFGDYGSLKARMHNLSVLKAAKSMANEFAINLSMNSINDVDRAMDAGFDTVVITPGRTYKKELHGPKVFKTKKGRKVVTCPGKYGDSGINCVNCGKGRPLCTRKGRDYAIGFPASGGARRSLNVLRS